MNRHLDQIIFNFLQKYYDPSSPVLLGLSGGPDSLALFYLLLKYKENHSLSLGIAHIDHGWRQESTQEANELKRLAQEHSVPFFLKKISPDNMQGNLEAACRQERLLFFKEIMESQGYQAVLLAHHSDDQAETVLKRVLEGADLPFLSGLQEENWVHGVKVWRPLLQASKKEILQWLEQYGAEAFTDKTNLDPQFLRGRFRTQIIPFLSKAFGKEVTTSLCHLGEEAHELKQYLKTCMGHYLNKIQKGPFGSLLDLSDSWPEQTFELRYLIKELCRQEGFVLPRSLTDTVCNLATENKGNREVQVGDHIVQIDRRRLFVVSKPIPAWSESLDLTEGQHHIGPWTILVTSTKDSVSKTGWANVWSGKFDVVLPRRQYQLRPVDLHAFYPGEHTPISKWWTNEKVPAFLRHSIPVIYQGDRLCHEFLAMRQQPKPLSDPIKISLSFECK